MLTEEETQVVLNAASDMHNDWRAKYINTDEIQPYIVVTKDGYESDINIPFNELLPEFQKKHTMIASYIVSLLKMNKYTIYEMFSNIYEFSLKSVPLSKNNDINFNKLSPIEQDKTIRMYNIVLQHYLKIMGLKNY